MHELTLPRNHVDFETRSTVKVSDTGAWRYAEHPDTEVVCMGYKLSTGEKAVWDARLGEPFPQCVIDRIEAGEVFCAHNCQFEKAIFKYILSKVGIPMPKYWLDTMAVCAYRSIPLGLDKAGEVLKLDIVKDKRGKYLISRLSSPRKPLKADKDLFELMGLSEDEWPTLYVEDDELHQEFKDYCIRDVDTEEELSRVLGDLPIQEYKIWLLDQEINERGLTVDVESVKAAKRLADQVSQQLTLELIDVTNGVVRSGNQNAVMLQWLQERGYGYEDLRKDTVEKSLDDETLDPEVRRVLELRQQLSKASTKKLDKFIQCVNSDGKIRGLLQYHGAGTGRWAGRLVQPQNMPRGTIDADNVFEVLHMPDAKEVIEMVLGDPLEAISSSLRGMLTASEGNDLYVADFSAIEARVLAWLAGEEKMLEVFYAYDAGTGPDVYCSMAAEIYNKPVNKKDNHKERRLGKIGVLGCFGPDTLVLTHRGWVRIVDVSDADIVWDGEEWVEHGGVIYQGQKKTMRLNGVRVTPDHMFLTSQGWLPAQEVARLDPDSYLVSEKFTETLLSEDLISGVAGAYGLSWSHARAPLQNCIVLTYPISEKDGHGAATLAPSRGRVKLRRNCTDTQTSSKTIGCEKAGSDGGTLSLVGAIQREQATTRYTEEGGYQSINLGGALRGSSQTYRNSPDGMSSTWSSTELTMTGTTSPETSEWPTEAQTPATPEGQEGSFMTAKKCTQQFLLEGTAHHWLKQQSLNGSEMERHQSSALKTESFLGPEESVYDLLNCGPRNRFCVMTDEGIMVAHNCGYQMGPGALQAQAEASYKVILDEDTAKLIVSTYRTTYSKVVSFWYDTEDAAIKAVELGVPVQAGKVVWETVKDKAGYWLTATLPNGKRLWYLEPKIDWIDFFGKRKKSLSYAGKDNKKGGSWGRVRTYGGMLVENVTQAFARELMADAMFRTEAEGFASVLSVHDEIVSDGPKGMDMKLFERTMAGPNPDWAKGCPVEVEGMVTRRYRK